jgi:predicted dehydrogenase
VQGLSGLQLTAVASGTQPKADAAAKAFGIRNGYADGRELIKDPAVDIVTIAVKVPDHRELVLAALEAGKHIYCEWPLGRNLAETKELAAAADAAKVHVVIGLQTRLSSAAVHARALLSSGAIGRPLASRIFSSTVAFGAKVEAAMSFAEDAANGVTLVTIQGAHTLDFAIAVLGPFADIAALATTQYPEIEVGDPPAQQTRSTPDHLLAQARFSEGTALSLEVSGGRTPEASTFWMEIEGEKGAIRIDGGAVRGFQSGKLTVSLRGELQRIDEGEVGTMTTEAANVAGMYAALRDDILLDRSTVPDFEHAARLAKLIDDVMVSSESGCRKVSVDWPQ